MANCDFTYTKLPLFSAHSTSNKNEEFWIIISQPPLQIVWLKFFCMFIKLNIQLRVNFQISTGILENVLTLSSWLILKVLWDSVSYVWNWSMELYLQGAMSLNDIIQYTVIVLVAMEAEDPWKIKQIYLFITFVHIFLVTTSNVLAFGSWLYLSFVLLNLIYKIS